MSELNPNEYEQLKNKNRRRLIGAGALTLLAGGVFATIFSSSPENSEPQLAEEQAASRPAAASAAAPIQAASETETASAAAVIDQAADVQEQESEEAKRLNAQRELERIEAEQNRQQQQAAQNARSAQLAAEKERQQERNRLINGQNADSQPPARPAETAHSESAPQTVRTERQAADRSVQAERRERERAAVRERAEKQAARKAADLEARREAQKARAALNNKAAQADASKEKKRLMIIQAGAYRDKSQARRVQQELSKLNYESHLEAVNTDNGTVYRVRTGTFPNDSEARLALKKIQNRGLNGTVLGHERKK